MRLPPWAIEALRNGVADVARKASDAETLAKVKEQAKELFRDLPENASKGLDAIVKTATDTAKQAVDQGRDTILRWTQRSEDFATPCLNATGVLLDSRGHGIAVSDYTLQRGAALLRGDHAHASDGRHVRDEINDTLTKLLDQTDKRVLVATSLDAAVAALTAVADDYPIAIHRSQAIRLPSGLPLPECFDGITIKECGGVQTIAPADFAELDHPCIVLADNGQAPVKPIDSSTKNVVTVAVLPVAAFKGSDLPNHDDGTSIPAADAVLESGIDLVIFAGGPTTGGPACGYIAGKAELIESIEKRARWKTLAADDAIAGMAVAAATDPEPSPLHKLLSTNQDNLQNRADRMAIRFSAEDEIAECTVSDSSAHLVNHGRWNLPSRQLRLRHNSLSANSWATKLAEQSPAILANVEDDELVIDLRWISASQDTLLAEGIAPEPDRASNQENDTTENDSPSR